MIGKRVVGWMWAAAIAVLGAVSGIGVAQADGPRPWEMYFQAPISPIAERFHEFHGFLLVLITLITLFVAALLALAYFLLQRRDAGGK